MQGLTVVISDNNESTKVFAFCREKKNRINEIRLSEQF